MNQYGVQEIRSELLNLGCALKIICLRQTLRSSNWIGLEKGLPIVYFIICSAKSHVQPGLSIAALDVG